jgi:hypothetical protein
MVKELKGERFSANHLLRGRDSALRGRDSANYPHEFG